MFNDKTAQNADGRVTECRAVALTQFLVGLNRSSAPMPIVANRHIKMEELRISYRKKYLYATCKGKGIYLHTKGTASTDDILTAEILEVVL